MKNYFIQLQVDTSHDVADSINVMTPKQIYEQFVIGFGLSSAKKDNVRVDNIIVAM